MINVVLRVLEECEPENSEYFDKYHVTKDVDIIMPCEPMPGDLFWFDCGTDDGFTKKKGVVQWEVVLREYSVCPNHTDKLPIFVSTVYCLIRPKA